jgi:hypothetical protein
VTAPAAVPVRDGQPHIGDPLPVVRRVVRDLLLSSPSYRALDRDSQHEMAAAMVKVCYTAAALKREEIESDSDTAAPPRQETLAVAQEEGPGFGASAERVAGTTRAILNAVSFPRFVTELINGVFKAIIDSNQQQMNMYVDLLKNVAASVDGFADANVGADGARAWLVERFPDSFQIEGDAEADAEAEPGSPSTRRLVNRPGARPPSSEALKTGLGVDVAAAGDPERTLVPLARAQLARQRQQMLATMVMLGMQRIVIDSGRITASMRFHIDTKSVDARDKGSTFDFRNTINASGSYGAPSIGWGVSAQMTNTIGYVSTQKAQTTEEMNTDLDLNSSVELNFHSDYLPLNRLASPQTESAIRSNSLNPQEEERQAAAERAKRKGQAAQTQAQRSSELDKRLGSAPPAPPPPKSGEAGTVAHADKLRTTAKSLATPIAGPTAGYQAPVAPRGAMFDDGGRTAESLQACGFIDVQGGSVPMAALRLALAHQAEVERARWRAVADGRVLLEDEAEQFGHLVRYWLARVSTIRPSTLTALQARAIDADNPVDYGALALDQHVNAATLQAARQHATAQLLAALPNAPPAGLDGTVTTALNRARESLRNEGDYREWSAVFVVACVRRVAIRLGIEGEDANGVQVGRDRLLLGSQRHRDFLVEAHARGSAQPPITGTYHAFAPLQRAVQEGDIIVQDRDANDPNDVISFEDSATMERRPLHSDIVVRVADDHVVAIGGNLGQSVRYRHYPIDANGRLVVDVHQRYTAEDNHGAVPPLPEAHAANTLHGRSTARIFALLSLVEDCV